MVPRDAQHANLRLYEHISQPSALDKLRAAAAVNIAVTCRNYGCKHARVTVICAACCETTAIIVTQHAANPLSGKIGALSAVFIFLLLFTRVTILRH